MSLRIEDDAEKKRIKEEKKDKKDAAVLRRKWKGNEGRNHETT